MFATIIGPYPEIPDASSEHERLTAVLGDQLEAGLGLLTDGRLHRVTGAPGGVVRAWRAADTVARHLAEAEGLGPPLVKACLVGPWSLGGGDPGAVRSAATRLAAAIDALFEAGSAVVQLTEPGVGSIGGADRAAIELLGEVLEGLAAPFVGAGHLALAVAGGAASQVPPDRLMVGMSSYLFDLIASPDDWNACARVPGDAGLVVGVVDPRPGRPGVREVGVWGARYAASMGGRGAMRTGVCPGSGIERLDRDAARGVLALAADVARAADLPDQALAEEVDPMAVDARSGALGRGGLRPRRRPAR